MPKVEDVTDYCLRDASNGPGENVARVIKAKPAKTLTPSLQTALDKWNRQADRSIGYTSKALAYGFKYMSKTDHANMIRLIKGGQLKVCAVRSAPPPGSNAHRGSPYGDRYYLVRPDCPPELPDGTLHGKRRKR